MLQSAHHHKYQIPDGCLKDTTLHKHCHNTATLLSTLQTFAWDAVGIQPISNCGGLLQNPVLFNQVLLKSSIVPGNMAMGTFV